MSDEGCACMAHPRPPCSWCENGGDSCRTCEGEGEGEVASGQAPRALLRTCADCGGTGVDPQYHGHDCECAACDPDFREVEPEPVTIGIDMGKEPAAIAVSGADYREWPEISERYLAMVRKSGDDSFFRKRLLQDWQPEPRPLVVVGTPMECLRVKRANPDRMLVHGHSPHAVAGMIDFDFVVYAPKHATATETRQMLDIVETIRSRRGVREISIEEAEGRAADLDRHGQDALDALAYMTRAFKEAQRVTGLPPDPMDRQTELALRREPGLREWAHEHLGKALAKETAPKTTVTRITGYRREDATVAATVHENAHNLGPHLENGADHRIGWKP